MCLTGLAKRSAPQSPRVRIFGIFCFGILVFFYEFLSNSHFIYRVIIILDEKSLKSKNIITKSKKMFTKGEKVPNIYRVIRIYTYLIPLVEKND